MGLFKDSLKVVTEVVTLGGAGRFEKAKLAYEDSHDKLQSALAQANGLKTRINDAVESIGSSLTHAKPHLEMAERLIKCRVERPGVDDMVTMQTLLNVERFNAGMNAALSVGAGSIAGGTLAVGAWSLVAVFGSASTGTAISGLYGVAATNATLAWFGGGALAAGGAGMAGGMAVVGGIAAIPLVYVAAKRTHKKAKELEDLKVKVEESIIEVRSQIDTLPAVVAVAEARRQKVEQLCGEVVAKIVQLKKVVRPLGPLSAAKQRIFAVLGIKPYTTEQSDAIAQLSAVLATFLAAFDAQPSGARLVV